MEGNIYSLGHERNVNRLPVEFRGVLGRLGYVSAVHEPEPRRDGGGEVDAVVDERERRGASDVLPLGSRRPTCIIGVGDVSYDCIERHVYEVNAMCHS